MLHSLLANISHDKPELVDQLVDGYWTSYALTEVVSNPAPETKLAVLAKDKVLNES